MRDMKRAFGSPDPVFHERVQQTLYQIEEKEDALVKKKLTLSMALALTACLTIAFITAFAASDLTLAPRPDATETPLAQNSEQSDMVWLDRVDLKYHQDSSCPYLENRLPDQLFITDALLAGGTPCEECLNPTDAGDYVCFTGPDDPHFHLDPECGALTGDTELPLTKALAMGLTPCAECILPAEAYFDEPQPTPPPTEAPGATPVPAGYASGVYCWIHPDSPFYHEIADCSGLSESHRATVEYAQELGLIPCDTCMGGTVYCSSDSMFYHCEAEAGCFGETGLIAFPRVSAVLAGKQMCPVCMRGDFIIQSGDELYPYFHADPECDVLNATNAGDRLGVTLYLARLAGKNQCPSCSGSVVLYAPGDRVYHLAQECLELNGLTENPAYELFSLEAALDMGIPGCEACLTDMYLCSHEDSFFHESLFICPELEGKTLYIDSYSGTQFNELQRCPVCLPVAGGTPTPMPMPTAETPQVYYSEDGAFYHLDPKCSGEKRLYAGSIAEALNLNKAPCPDCVSAPLPTPTPMPSATAFTMAEATPIPVSTEAPASSYMYFATENGQYYHLNARCSGMENAHEVTREEAEARGQAACPTCAEQHFSMPVYACDEESVYHFDSDCPLAAGYRLNPTYEEIAVAVGQIACYGCMRCYLEETDGRPVYHVQPGCGLASEVSQVLLVDAVDAGVQPCDACVFWIAQEDSWFHADSDCSAARSAVLYIPAACPYALSQGRSECPLCVGGEAVFSELPAQSGYSGDTSPLISTQLTNPLPAPGDTPRMVNVVIGGLSAGESGLSDGTLDIAPQDDSFIALHSIVMLQARGCIYMELEFTPKDLSLDPASLRVSLYSEQTGALGWQHAEVKTLTYDNGETGYLLCETMDMPADLSIDMDRIRLYGGASPDEHLFLTDII